MFSISWALGSGHIAIMYFISRFDNYHFCVSFRFVIIFFFNESRNWERTENKLNWIQTNEDEKSKKQAQSTCVITFAGVSQNYIAYAILYIMLMIGVFVYGVEFQHNTKIRHSNECKRNFSNCIVQSLRLKIDAWKIKQISPSSLIFYV